MIPSVVSNVMLSFPFGDAKGTMSISRKETFKSNTFIFLLFFAFYYYTFFQKKGMRNSRYDDVPCIFQSV